ncbi:hypothetical protein P8935_15085 [Telmatobacter sp. DSM 110680]|uniref:Uncharacterized protein n=1 Tax=Telmatobacter sp. DSM 110680 TaxID=3036704 RepID=A0AAU7DEX2_9BACT
MKLAVVADETIEIRHFSVEGITYAFDRIEGNAAHGSESGDGGGFHVDKGRFVGGGEAAFFGLVGYAGTGGEPELSGMGVAVEALTGSGIDDAGTIVSAASRDFGGEGARPADRDDEVDGPAVLDPGESAGGGGESGSSTGGNPLFFFSALGPKLDGAASGVWPTVDKGFQFAGHSGDDGDSGHGA